MKRPYNVFFILALFFWFLPLVADQKPLSLDSIHEVMDTVFSKHVIEKKMTPQIAQRAIALFITQFDPEKVYLLKSEIQEYLQCTQRELNEFVKDYYKNDYSLFKKINAVFQKAILRARKTRQAVLGQTLPIQGLEHIDSFAKDTQELEVRQQVFFLEIVRRRGDITPALAQEVNEEICEQENSYLYQDKNRHSIGKQEEEYFTFHILRALTASLDAHTSFLSTQEAQDLKIEITEGHVDTTYRKVPGGIIAVIALHSFYQSDMVSSEKDVINALKDLSSKGKIQGLVLDLRDNYGGFLMQAVRVAGLFIKSGVVVICKYSDGSIDYFRDLDPRVYYSGPLVVLTSRGTASSAEIVAQALKDYGVAVIVGDEHTYGKGSIQMQTVVGDAKEDQFFKVTVGQYYSVSGMSTQREGVKADCIVPGPEAQKKIGESYLEETLANDSLPPAFNDQLSDVQKEQLRWYQEYYIPYLQKPTDHLRKYIPQLVKKSAVRMKEDNAYQQALKSGNEKELSEMQLEEAIQIVEDLSKLSKQHY